MIILHTFKNCKRLWLSQISDAVYVIWDTLEQHGIKYFYVDSNQIGFYSFDQGASDGSVD